MDELTQITCAALSQARAVQQLINDRIVPTLHPSRRTFAQHLSRRIERGEIFSEQFLNDLEAFIGTVRQIISDRTYVGWEADEHHAQGGFEFIWRDPCAETLRPTLNPLSHLRVAIAQVLDTVRAAFIASRLAAE